MIATDEHINGMEGNDTINGFGGDDCLIGGTGDDVNWLVGFGSASSTPTTDNY